MTIAKLITCKVDAELKNAFSDSQCAWQALTDCHGFKGQIGGWQTLSQDAVIVGFWESDIAVSQFMDQDHDRIFINSRQASTYQHCSVEYFELQSGFSALPKCFAAMTYLQINHFSGIIKKSINGDDSGSLSQGQLIPLARCSDLPTLVAMSVWRSRKNVDEVMLLTCWNDTLPTSMPTSQSAWAIDDLIKPMFEHAPKKLSSHRVAIEHLWGVVPAAL